MCVWGGVGVDCIHWTEMESVCVWGVGWVWIYIGLVGGLCVYGGWGGCGFTLDW